MKPKIISLLFLATVLTGCRTYVPTDTVRTISYSDKIKTDDVCEAIIDAARDSNLPAVTKMDKADGIIEFGSFEMPEYGLTAQVRLRTGDQLDITVRRGTAFISMSAGADEVAFQTKLEARLVDLANQAGK